MLFVMAKRYQLVAWTDNGQVRMIPSEVTAFLHAELNTINRLIDLIRYRTIHERGDILRVSKAYEKLAVRLLDLGRIEDAFEQYVHAAQCCLSSNEWDDTDWGDVLCGPLRGRFFAMFGECKNLVRRYPRLKYNWEISGLQRSCDRITYAFRLFEKEWNDCGDDIS